MYLRFRADNKDRSGILDGADIVEISPDCFSRYKKTGIRCKLEKAKILPPVQPSKIVAIGLNYTDHTTELGMKVPSEPIIFLKPPTAVIGHNDSIVYPKTSKRVDYEAELAVVIGKKAKDIKERDAHKYIFGYTCFNDVTARDLQKIDGQWTRAKSFDTFCPLGPYIASNIDVSDLKIEAYLNGKRVQSSSTKNMIFKVPYIVSFISSVMTLNPGDIIATGTPVGVGPMKPGDDIEIRIEKIGSLTNKIAEKK